MYVTTTVPLALFHASRIWSDVAPVRAPILLKGFSKGPPGCFVTGLSEEVLSVPR
jgi:hypothetical protein